jgi:hypothetical protein
MIKVFTLENIDPEDALRLVQESSVINYMINWGCNIDKKNQRLVFQLKHGGGDFPEELNQAVKDLEKFIQSIDIK